MDSFAETYTLLYLLFKKKGFYLEALTVHEIKVRFPYFPSGKLLKMTVVDDSATYFFEEGLIIVSL